MRSNAELASLGLDDLERDGFWREKTAAVALTKADPNRQVIIDAYLQVIIDLNMIISYASPTEAQQNWAIKREAEILKQILQFLKEHITP